MLSVIIPIYNGKKYIQKTVTNILKINYDIEIILVDDGSTDGSFEYCNNIFSEHKDVVKIFRKENGGIASARNYGVSKARGEIIAFCDHDDVINVKTIEKALNQFDNSYDLLMWSTEIKYDNGQVADCGKIYCDTILDKNEINNLLLNKVLYNKACEKISYIGSVWAGIYKKSIIYSNNLKFRKIVDYEDDLLFLLDYLSVSNSVKLISDTGYYWTYNIKSETYRQKYIDDIYNKQIELFDYMYSVISNIDTDKEKYELYTKQHSFIRSIENCCTCINKYLIKDCIFLLKLFKSKEFKEVFNKTSVLSYEKRQKRIYKLLNLKLPVVAFMYVYLDSIYRYIMGNFNKVFM